MGETYSHRPVLLHECIEALNIRPDGIYLDGTLGRGGHSQEIVKRLSGRGRLLCIDRDRQALEEADEVPAYITYSAAGGYRRVPTRMRLFVIFVHSSWRKWSLGSDCRTAGILL